MSAAEVEAEVARLAALNVEALRREWRSVFQAAVPPSLTKDLIARTLTHRVQAKALGELSSRTHRLLRELASPPGEPQRQVKAGSVIVREYKGVLHQVLVIPGGFCWQEQSFDSLSTIAKAITGTNWNGPRFFGLRSRRENKVAPGCDKAVANQPVVAAKRSGRRTSLAQRVTSRGAFSTLDGTAGASP